MTTFEHEVSEPERQASRWDEEYTCWITPDGRCWRYTDDPSGEGVSHRDHNGEPISVAVWLEEDEEEALYQQAQQARVERVQRFGDYLQEQYHKHGGTSE